MVLLLSGRDISPQNCFGNIIYAEYLPLSIVISIQLLIAFISLPFVALNLVIFFKRKGTLHANFLIVYTNAFIFYGIHSTAIFIFHTSKLITYLTYDSPCDLFTLKLACDIYKTITYICLFGFTLAHAGISIERGFATYLAKKYEKLGKTIGIVLTILMWLISIISNFLVDRTSDQMFTNPYSIKDYCISIGNGQGSSTAHYYMLAIDGLATIFDIFLLKINKRKEIENIIAYNLSKRFQVAENFSTIKTIIPIVTTHSILFTLYLLCAVIIRLLHMTNDAFHRTIYEACYTLISIYILAMMLVILKAPIGKKKMQNQIYPKNIETNVYFKQLRSQFGDSDQIRRQPKK